MKIDKGPAEVLRALLSGDRDSAEVQEALQFQRESFKAKYGSWPEELKPVPRRSHDQVGDQRT